ncbi:hypothetical protein D9M68_881260 [compost metagenome]
MPPAMVKRTPTKNSGPLCCMAIWMMRKVLPHSMVTSTRAISWRDRANIDVLGVTACFECYECGQYTAPRQPGWPFTEQVLAASLFSAYSGE